MNASNSVRYLRLLAWVARIVGIAVLTVIFAVVVRVVVYYIPHSLYRARRPVAAADCSNVKPGMTLQEVQTIFDHDIPPRQLFYDNRNHRLAAYREFATACVVEFDPASKRVVKAYVENLGVGFPDL